ncbi:minor capsid protein [Hespellia stercorisuis]|uniref:Phage putative head morphogenesis protein, SPP1 gp7 family n=1 Tax=Hespellia stercorisuis DSM 15480 TaxID=1121950 RepID=A0A1M6RN88_9FIRM|nr:minor capsid protein [Hespellia stercorisuis]SHK33981.1 phage putative head morphogenesis protein, SPP1 gp7 family [Hespellia stercorisuis DSM 15480]
MVNLSYWEQRQVQNMYEYMQSAEDTAEEIGKLYLKASRYISSSAVTIFEKFQTKHGLSIAEAMRLINTMQDKASLDELLMKLRSDDHDKNKSELLSQLEAPAFQARLERLKQVQNELDYVMSNLYQQEKAFNTSHYVDLANEAYYRGIYDIQQRAGAAFSFNHIDKKMIDRVVDSKWSGENYSSRIWKNTSGLAQDVKEELLINLVTGRTNREVAQIISNKYAVGASQARRLVRTESNYIATELNFKAYEEAGIEKYLYLATLDLRTSKVCRDLDGQIFLVKERAAGVNCPPMHPWCRSTTISVISEELLAKLKRSTRDPVTGKIIRVPMTMKYAEWYDKYVRGNKDTEYVEKKINNHSSDRTQYERYKKILGKEIPGTLDKFQEMKYNEAEKWRYTKLAYERQNKLIDHPELKLPNVDTAVAADAKFEKYLFGGDHPEGLNKGANITKRLGYGLDSWKDFRKEILEYSRKYPATYKDNTEYGDRYEQKMILFGKTGNPTNVVVGWIVRPNGVTSMSSAYIKEV